MASKDLRWRSASLLFLLGVLASVPAFAGSAVIGSVAGSTNATLGGQALLPNQTVFSGDSLQIKDGVAVVAVGNSSRMVFGKETVASFLRDTNDVTVLLSQGNVSLYHPNDSAALKVKAGTVTVVPANGFKTLGDIAMINGAVVVTSKEGLLRVNRGSGSAVDVAKGKTFTILPETARTPATGAGGGMARISSSSAISVASLGAGVLSAILGAVAISRANDARDAASAATSTAAQADADAVAATSAAKAAGSAAGQAASNANTAGCALNKLNINLGNQFGGNKFAVSPYTPPTGFTCP